MVSARRMWNLPPTTTLEEVAELMGDDDRDVEVRVAGKVLSIHRNSAGDSTSKRSGTGGLLDHFGSWTGSVDGDELKEWIEESRGLDLERQKRIAE